MIYTVNEQLIMIIYFVIMGMSYAVFYNTLIYLITNLKFFFKITLEFLFWFGMCIYTYFYILRVSDGYLSIYSFVFIVVGVIIYYKLLSKDYIFILNNIKRIVNNVYKKSKKILIIVFIPDFSGLKFLIRRKKRK